VSEEITLWRRKLAMAKSEEFWNKMAGKFDEQVDRKYGDTYRKTIALSKKYLSTNHTVLDFACGTGIATVGLAKFTKQILAIDTSCEMIDVARAKTASRQIDNVEYAVTSIFDSQFDDLRVDVVLAFNILHFVQDIDALLTRIRELLPARGIFISATDCFGERSSIGTALLGFLSKVGILPFARKYSTDELEDKVRSAGFKVIETQDLHHSPPNHFIVSRR
jgi:2-polyprenyl-3-methyl-5-hydroxy-6-metoxy-1,4-benzoquinol methylase